MAVQLVSVAVVDWRRGFQMDSLWACFKPLAPAQNDSQRSADLRFGSKLSSSWLARAPNWALIVARKQRVSEFGPLQKFLPVVAH